MTLKELYKAKSLEDLKQYYKIGDISKKKLKLLLNAAQKLYEEAEKCLLDGDEELGYIHFMKYFNVISQIRKSPDYSKEKQYITQMLGGSSRQMFAMDQAEKLCKSLEKRYEKLATETKNETLNNIDDDNGNKNHVNYGEKTSYNGKNSTLSAFNTCEELYRMTQDPEASLLIMDCRPEDDYKSSRLHYRSCVNVPEEIILPGMSAGTVQHQLESNSKALWASRSIKDNVVLMDWNSQGPEPVLNTPIWRLKDILQNWDPDVTYKSPIKILQGGYENYILCYPTQCTNPYVQAPLNLKDEMGILDTIEYPSIHDISMKDELRNIMNANNDYSSTDDKSIVSGTPSTAAAASSTIMNFLRPQIDRSSKAAALQTYDQKKQHMFEMLQEQEMMVDKTLNAQKKRREATNQWETITNEVNESETEDKKNKLLAGQQELIYNIMQLESNERDYKLQIERLKEQLEDFRRREKELGDAITAKEAENLEEARKRIEVKRDQIIDEEKENIDEMREKQTQLQIVVRNEKRHLKPPLDEDEISKPPKIPQFDRSVKPFFQPLSETVRTSGRDFSPVPGQPLGPGLAGLKNLGNTCYINSILQCLSNTTSLAQYLKSNTYRKHINRSNETKGEIVEEVAELIKVLWSGKFKCVASKDLRIVIGKYQKLFRGTEQQDSHEFLTILIDWLHSDLQTIKVDSGGGDINNKVCIKDNHLPASEKAWLDYTNSYESYILRLFYGQIKSTVKCYTCSRESATYECFSNLSLELPQIKNRCDLYNCLDMYFYGEKINGWNCPNCKQKRDAIKKLDISKLPPILVIHLKRFYADDDALGRTIYRKKQTYVDFPLTNLDMSEYIAPSEKSRIKIPRTYNLYAVSNHYGSMESGHYTAFCKNGTLGRWFKFDDQIVYPLDSIDVVSSAAYILFYTYLPETTNEVL